SSPNAVSLLKEMVTSKHSSIPLTSREISKSKRENISNSSRAPCYCLYLSQSSSVTRSSMVSRARNWQGITPGYDLTSEHKDSTIPCNAFLNGESGATLPQSNCAL